MKKTICISLLLLVICMLIFTSCDSGSTTQTPSDTTAGTQGGHTHSYDEWIQVKQPTCTADGINERYCSCGEKQTQTIAAYNHEEVVDQAISPTCTSDGKTEGTHCERCKAVLTPQTNVPSPGHQYNNGEITTQATCNQNGVKKFTCTVNSCRHSYTESFYLKKYIICQ